MNFKDTRSQYQCGPGWIDAVVILRGHHFPLPRSAICLHIVLASIEM
jgi:hypothetical protein